MRPESPSHPVSHKASLSLYIYIYSLQTKSSDDQLRLMMYRKMEQEGLDVHSNRNADHYGALVHHLSLIRNKRCLMAYVYITFCYQRQHNSRDSLTVCKVLVSVCAGTIEQTLIVIWHGELALNFSTFHLKSKISSPHSRKSTSRTIL